MRWPRYTAFFLTLLLLLVLVAGCTSKNTETTSGDSALSESQRISQLEEELRSSRAAFASLEREVDQLKEGVPPAVYRALALHAFNEFKQGRPPEDLIEGDGFEFWVGVKEGLNRDPVSKDNIDFTPIIEWFRAHPDAKVESIEIWPGSKNERVWMNLKSADGFYVRVAFISYHLRAFIISEEPIPWE